METKTKKQEKEDQKAEALARLRELCPPGTKVWTVLRSVARSGMSRGIDCYVFEADEAGNVSKAWLSWYMGRAGIGGRWNDKSECLTVGGCGMDMGYYVVNCLSYALHGMEDKGVDAHGRNTDQDNYRAGYSLHHEWI